MQDTTTRGAAYLVIAPPDSDDDGVYDGVDNCIGVPNSGPRDSNATISGMPVTPASTAISS
jgi:hypothetical protein